MGWISDRHMRRGGSLNNNCANNGARKGPLRRIRYVMHAGTNMFDTDWVKFECGHEGRATIGAERGRCSKCKRPTKDTEGRE